MQPETLLRWSWMNVLTKKRYDALLATYASLDTALQHVSASMLTELGCRQDSALLALTRLEEFDPQAYLQALQQRGVSVLAIDDAEYPSLLRTLPDPPVFLYWRGDLSVLNQPCIALVGSRQMGEYGKRVTDAIVPQLVAAGAVTVSGLAEGIDGQVARATLRAGGNTVAVLGHGLGSMFPKAHASLADDIVATGGAILSEYPLDTRSDKFTFPARNRIIAGLAVGTVVLQAAQDSGSLITAALALEYGRDVLAVPGDIFDPQYAGCHSIIARGQAKLVCSAEEILSEVGIVSAAAALPSASYVAQTPEEAAILGALTTLPQPIDDLVASTKLDAAMLNATLTMLELQGAAHNVGGGKWVRV